MSDLARTIAFAYRRKGADAMSGTDLRMLLAYDLRWFAPEDAKRVVMRALERGLLIESDGVVRPAFDVKAIEIPVNFRPTTLVLEEEASVPRMDPAPRPVAPLVPAVAATNDLERAAEDERRKRGLLLSLEVARLIVRRRAGDDVAAEATAAESTLLSAAAPPRP